MSATYKAIGINLKGMPLGESDRLLTVLTREFGLVRVVAPGARKHKSKLGGRSGLFVVNELLIAKGKSLDKIVQADSLESYPGLSQDLKKLTASQYLAELVLCQALAEQPQEDLFDLFNAHLSRLEKLPPSAAIANLVQATFHLLMLAGLEPQVQTCCVTQRQVIPNFADPNWRIGFSVAAGGVVQLSELERLAGDLHLPKAMRARLARSQRRSGSAIASIPQTGPTTAFLPELCIQLHAVELALLQQLSQSEGLLESPFDQAEPDGSFSSAPESIWLSVERVLRHYAQYHFEQPIRSAALIDTFSMPMSSVQSP